MTHHIVTGGEVREIGRLIIAFSEALGVEPNSVSSDELCERVRALVQERDDLGEQVEQQHEINRGWVDYGQRAKGQRRKYAEDLAAAIGYDQQRWLPIEGMIPLAAQRTKSLTDEIERLGKVVASWQSLWESKEEWEQAATESWTRSDALSGLLRGMARRVGEMRQSLRFADAHVPQWERIIGEHKAEIERLEQNEEFLERAVHIQIGCCDGSDVPCDMVVTENLYRRVRERYYPTATGPNPWFTPAEFPIEQHEREVADLVEQIVAKQADPDFRKYLLGKRREDCNILFGGKDSRERNSNEQVAGALSLSSLDHLRKQFEKILSRYDAHTLINGEWPEADDDEGTVRNEHAGESP